jgi:hypothetical protein
MIVVAERRWIPSDRLWRSLVTTLSSLLFWLLAAVLAGSATAAPPAVDSTIEKAPVLTLGQEQRSGVDGIAYWRIPMRRGDELTIRFGSQAFGVIGICLLVPEVTDRTVGNQPCSVHQRGVSGMTSFDITAISSGSWVLAVYAPACEVNGQLDPQCRATVAYALTAYVKHSTSMTVTAPNLVRLGTQVSVRGRVDGGAVGAVLAEVMVDGQWKTLDIVDLAAKGRFAFEIRPKSIGDLHLRVTYPEAPLYRPASREVTVRVA